jgi:5-methylcytosine-specific restriction protein A
MRLCAEPKCSNLTAATRCEKHRKAKRRVEDARRPTARERGYDKKWRTTRRMYLATFPICQWPAGCLNPATDVHHIDGKGPLGKRGNDWMNLQGLCHAHHSQVTAREQPGGFNG